MRTTIYTLLLFILATACSGNVDEPASDRIEVEDTIDLTPLWESYVLPELDSTYSMQEEEFYDGYMRIMGEDFPSTVSNHVTTESETIFQWCYYPEGRMTEIEIQFMPINEFMEGRIDNFVPESGTDEISAVLYEDDTTYLYEFFDLHDKGRRRYYNFLLERKGYYIICGPNVRYDMDSPDKLLYSLAVAESFEITRHPNDHSLDDFEIHDLHMEEWKEERGY